MSDMMLERPCRDVRNARCSEAIDWVESGTGWGEEDSGLIVFSGYLVCADQSGMSHSGATWVTNEAFRTTPGRTIPRRATRKKEEGKRSAQWPVGRWGR